MEVLKRADDEELRYYLLPLVQALRYEPSDDSRLARFLVSRATRDIALGVPLHWRVLPRPFLSLQICMGWSTLPSMVMVHEERLHVILTNFRFSDWVSTWLQASYRTRAC